MKIKKTHIFSTTPHNTVPGEGFSAASNQTIRLKPVPDTERQKLRIPSYPYLLP